MAPSNFVFARQTKIVSQEMDFRAPKLVASERLICGFLDAVVLSGKRVAT
jgi:hypothetical protein